MILKLCLIEKGKLGIKYAENQYQTLDKADALIIATEWSEFRTPDFDRVKDGIKYKIIFDGRNLFDIQNMKQQRFYYESIGRII